MDTEEIARQLVRFYEKRYRILPTGAFLQIHLLVKRQIKEFVLKSAPLPGALGNLVVKFVGWVQIAHAFGMIDEKMYEQLVFLDVVRNRLAHELDYQITGDTARELSEVMGMGGPAIGPNGEWQEQFFVLLGMLHIRVFELAHPGLTAADLDELIHKEMVNP